MTIKSFRDLRVWQKGMDLVESIYRLTTAFPAHEQYGLTNQLRRAIVSVPSNIAEGHARQHRKEYLQHLAIAQASLAEVETQLEIAARLDYLSGTDFQQILDQITALHKQLHTLRNALTRKPNPPDP